MKTIIIEIKEWRYDWLVLVLAFPAAYLDGIVVGASWAFFVRGF